MDLNVKAPVCRHRIALRAGCAALLFSVILCSSCSKQRPAAPTRGRITFDGQALRLGSVLFVPTEPGPTAQANLSSEGEYVLSTYQEGDGAVIGRHQIMVIALTESHRKQSAEGPPFASDDPPEDQMSMESVIPERYGDTRTSGLTANVDAGENRVDFALTSDPPSKNQ